jgi:small subunit ribosomal protein S14
VAKTSKIVKNEQRKQKVALYAERRADLKRLIADPATSFEARGEAQLRLQKLPRDASPIRVRNRDVADGRPRGYLRKAGISRVRFRTMAHRGELPGITKSSW